MGWFDVVATKYGCRMQGTTELVQANSMYMGLELKKGRHTIALRYCTPYIVPGMILTVLGLILFAGIVISYRRKGKQKERGKQEK